MRFFQRMYDRALIWAAHRHAPRYLAALSFAESSFFPVPPDAMLAPMVLANRPAAWRFAGLATLMSVLGGIAGYLIGKFLFDQIGQPVIDFYHAQARFDEVKVWFDQYGVWVVLVAGFTPIPYKVFTITSGVMSLALAPFTLASVVGRGGRFFLVAAVIYFGGERLMRWLRSWIDVLGWGCVVLVLAAYFALR